MTNQISSSNSKKVYDLKLRTAQFGKNILLFLMKLPQHSINKPLIGQLVRSAMSIGANYMEADGASSNKDFQNKISICRKETKETLHWLHMISVVNPDKQNECRMFWREAREFVLIFSAILKNKK